MNQNQKQKVVLLWAVSQMMETNPLSQLVNFSTFLYSPRIGINVTCKLDFNELIANGENPAEIEEMMLTEAIRLSLLNVGS